MASTLGNQSWKHVHHLVEEIGARGSGTEQEKQASEYVRSVLDEIDVAVDEQPFRSPASAWRPFAATLGLGAFASLIAPLFVPTSSLLAALLLAASFWLGIRESLLRDTILRRMLPQVDSQNIIGRLLPREEPKQTIVLVAHVDSHRTPYFHRSRRRQSWFGVMIVTAEIGIIVNVLLYIALSISGEIWLWWVSLPFALLHLVMALVCLTVDSTPFSPGANDNAAAVGTVLQVAEELSKHRLTKTDIWFLFSGCEEVGAYGMREFLQTFGTALDGARFIDLEMVGQGVPAVVIKEGLFRRVDYDPTLIEEAGEAATAVWQKAALKKANSYGESVVTQRAGFPSVTLNTILSETGKTAVWHRMDDDMSAISVETLDHVVTWVRELLRRLDDSGA
jgi:acetylornithine deacetylase/succinyl-diaminopimelate desuccinylase-like protein